MKLLLAMNQPYFPALGGANKGNRALMEGFARRGHTVRAVVPMLDTPARLPREAVLAQLRGLGVDAAPTGDADIYTLHGVEVHAAGDAARLRALLVEQMYSFQPDWVLISSENPSQNLLDAAVKQDAARAAVIVQATTYLPFGPQSFYPSRRRGALFEQAGLRIAVSRYIADYLREWGGVGAEMLRMPVYGEGPFPNHARFDSGYVTLVNPCKLKGISVFLALARALPDLRFAAVPTWGTTAEDRRELRSLANVTLLEPSLNFDEILAQSRVLLMPSLVHEGFGQTVVEAMLRGIPVLSSDAGGLREAKLGTDLMFAVRPIEQYLHGLDGNELPVPVVPEQDVRPWQAALSRLTTDRAFYAEQSAAARHAAHRFVEGLGVEQWEGLLETRLAARRPLATAAAANAAAPPERSAGRAAGGALGDLTPEQRALLMLRMRKKQGERAARAAAPAEPPITRAGRGAPLPLSFAQQRLWFLHRLDPASPLYNQPAAVRLRGPLRVAALQSALREIVRRHEILRTNFVMRDGRPVQVVDPAATFRIAVADLSGLAEPAREAAARDLAAREAQRPFDLSADRLLRVTLVRLAADDHICLFTTHHIVSDGWSMDVLIRELTELYRAALESRPARLPELAVQYADFAAWQQSWLSGEVLAAKLAYWERQLRGMPARLELPTDRPRPAAGSSRGGQRMFMLSEAVTAQLKALSQRRRATLFMTTLAAFLVLLQRHSGQTDVVVGTPIAGRNRLELESLIGFFINTLVLRTDLGGDPTFDDLLARVREVTLGAYANQDIPFEKLVEALQPQRSMAHMPLVQVLFALHNVPEATVEFPGLALEPVRGELGACKFDLALYLDERGPRLFGMLQYRLDLFEAATVERLIGQYEVLLEAAAAAPHQPISKLSAGRSPQGREMLADFNQAF